MTRLIAGNDRAATRYWYVLLATNVGFLFGYFVYKAMRDAPPFPYIHLLVDYHFGFAKRALIGAALSLVMAKVPLWMVFALGGAVILLALCLYLLLFRKTFTFDAAHLPLLVFIVGSPYFFKSFVQTVGYFDIYGCIAAIIMLLVPARSLGFVVLGAVLSIILILIHHVQMLLYVPTIAAIVVIRFHLRRMLSLTDIVVAVAAAACIGGVFVAAQFGGDMRISQPEFASYIQSRVGAGGEKTDPLQYAYVWFRKLPDEVRDTWLMLPTNLRVLPVNIALLALHLPLIGYFMKSIRALDAPRHRQFVWLAIAGISAGYLVVFATVFDYPRWLASWFVCMVLMLHAVKELPAANVGLIAGTDRTAQGLGAVLTFIPRLLKF